MNTPIVFLHGFPFNSSSWDLQAQHYSGQRPVMTPDLRGHRHGPKGPGPWMLQDLVSDIHELVTGSEHKKVVLCGVSMGGYIALDFVQRHPTLVQALVLVDTRADGDSNEAKDKRHAMLKKLHKEGLAPFAKDFSQKVLGETTLKSKPQIQGQVEAMILTNTLEDVALNVAMLASRPDAMEHLSQIKCPTLILCGDEDKVIPLEHSQKMADKIHRSQLKVIEQAGHLPNIEQPDVFNRHLDQFLRSIN